MKRVSIFKSLFLTSFLLSYVITSAQETKFQAIFLYKFIEAVNWPDDSKTLVIGILGETELQDEVEKMLRARGNSKLIVKQITAPEAISCNVVFLPKSQNSIFNSLMEKTTGKSILIVTEESNLAERGAGISFLKNGTKLSFIVNTTSLQTRNLKISGTLTSLGRQI